MSHPSSNQFSYQNQVRGLPPPPAPGQPPPQQFQGMQQQNLYQQQPQHQHHLYASHYPQQGKPVGHPGAYPGRPLCPPGPNQQVHHGVGARPPMMTTQPGLPVSGGPGPPPATRHYPPAQNNIYQQPAPPPVRGRPPPPPPNQQLYSYPPGSASNIPPPLPQSYHHVKPSPQAQVGHHPPTCPLGSHQPPVSVLGGHQPPPPVLGGHHSPNPVVGGHNPSSPRNTSQSMKIPGPASLEYTQNIGGVPLPQGQMPQQPPPPLPSQLPPSASSLSYSNASPSSLTSTTPAGFISSFSASSNVQLNHPPTSSISPPVATPVDPLQQLKLAKQKALTTSSKTPPVSTAYEVNKTAGSGHTSSGDDSSSSNALERLRKAASQPQANTVDESKSKQTNALQAEFRSSSLSQPFHEPEARKQHQQSTNQKDIGYGVRTSFVGIKRKGLANELMDSDSCLHHVAWTKLWDSDMPPEVMTKCRPLSCDLCEISLSSPLQAKLHYSGKIHDKHVRSYFIKVGVRPHLLPVKMDSDGKFPRLEEYKCDICKIDFTSESMLQSHKMGKNHKRQLAAFIKGEPALKAAQFDKDTKRWVKTDIKEDLGPPASIGKIFSTPEDFYCDLCKVSAPNEQQFEQHINGKNHKKKMAKGMNDVGVNDMISIQKRVQFKASIMSKIVGAKTGFNQQRAGAGGASNKSANPKFASFRTPSGGYYCGACNVSAPSEVQFGQHFNSKAHKHKEILMKSKY